MTKEEALNFIGQCGRQQHSGRRPSDNPRRTRLLLDKLGSPDRGMRMIHVCGSNGKGSVCAMLEAVLRAAGYSVGMFISPHIQDVCERIRINGQMISDHDFGIACEKIRPIVEQMNEPVGYFCLLTALAIDVFAEKRCDIAILETGIGGRYDATNAISAPDLAVVTAVSLEHTEILGDTLSEIAYDKAGIIKSGCACVSYDNGEPVNGIIRSVCRSEGADFTITDMSRAVIRDSNLSDPLSSLKRQTLDWDGRSYALTLPGDHQVNNASVVLTAVEVLRGRGYTLPEAAVREGFSHVRWPARLELICEDPVILLDGGHNPQCADALSRSLRRYFGSGRFYFILGMMRDKRVQETLRILLPLAETVYCVCPDDARGLPAEDMASLIRGLGGKAVVCHSVKEALTDGRQAASRADLPLIIFGSLYLAGEIRDLYKLPV